MSAFSSLAFSTSAFDTNAFSFSGAGSVQVERAPSRALVALINAEVLASVCFKTEPHGAVNFSGVRLHGSTFNDG